MYAAESDWQENAMEGDVPGAFVSRQRIYFDLVDLMGVVHNAAYLLLFERARTDWIQSHGFWYGSPDFDWPYYVVRNEVDYHAPITGGDDVTVTVAVEKLGTSSVTFAHEVFTGSGIRAAGGKTVVVRIDPDSKRPVPWSDRFRDLAAGISSEQ
jgi:acyl-CoA thioester hydrolase